MAWTKVGDDYQPDGASFNPPRDSFETRYNQVLAEGRGIPEDFSLHSGWPIPSGFMERRPDGQADTRNLLDWFFDSWTQYLARENGNSDSEMDSLAREALQWAVVLNVPITDAERNVARRLGVGVDHLARQEDHLLRHRRLGF